MEARIIGIHDISRVEVSNIYCILFDVYFSIFLDIPAIPAQDLTDTIKCGFLEKKQRKGMAPHSHPIIDSLTDSIDTSFTILDYI